MFTSLFSYATIGFLDASALPKVNIVVMSSRSGSLAFISDTYTVALHWQRHLLDKLLDPSWPFNATLEYYDVKSDPFLTKKYLLDRLNNKTLPNVTVIIGPESTSLGYVAATIAYQYGIPCVLAVTSANFYKPGRPYFLSTTFLMEAPAMYQFRTLVSAYVSAGVKSMVAVSFHEPENAYNDNTCFGTASLAASRGINVKMKLSLSASDTAEDVYNLVGSIRDKYNPDAIIWCDWASCALDDNVNTYNPLPAFKRANYLPKMLSMLDCLDQPAVQHLYDQGMFLYVTGGQYTNPKLRGSDYTEDSTPYSSTFRPVTPINYTVSIFTQYLSS